MIRYSQYNTDSTANACNHQKQKIFEITRHISRFYLQYKFHVRDQYKHINIFTNKKAVLHDKMRITFFLRQVEVKSW